MGIKVDELTGPQAVRLLRLVAHDWIKHRGIEAFSAYQAASGYMAENEISLPGWLEDDGDTADSENVQISRLALRTIYDNSDHPARKWLVVRLDELTEARAQVLDPLSLGIIGATFIGCILAARIKRIGNTEFYEGLPPELAKVLKGAAKLMGQ